MVSVFQGPGIFQEIPAEAGSDQQEVLADGLNKEVCGVFSGNIVVLLNTVQCIL